MNEGVSVYCEVCANSNTLRIIIQSGAIFPCAVASPRYSDYTLAMERKLPPTLIADALIFLLLSSLVIFISFAAVGSGSGYLAVQTPSDTYRYSLATDQVVSVVGPLGETQIEIRGGAALIINSTCPTKSCTLQKPISSSGKWIACLPNQILLTIVGSHQEVEVDDVAH